MILCGFLFPILAVPMGLVLFLISFQHHLELREALSGISTRLGKEFRTGGDQEQSQCHEPPLGHRGGIRGLRRGVDLAGVGAFSSQVHRGDDVVVSRALDGGTVGKHEVASVSQGYVTAAADRGTLDEIARCSGGGCPSENWLVVCEACSYGHGNCRRWPIDFNPIACRVVH